MRNLRKKIDLLLIDPQNDFAASGNKGKKGSLFVPGADEAMDRVAAMIDRLDDGLNDIHETLDSHHAIHIANPIFWKNSKGEHPAPFTIITEQDMLNGTWMTSRAGHHDRALTYLRKLKAGNRYDHCIWPPHCIIGEEGHGVYPSVAQATRGWCERNFGIVDTLTKGSNPFTEHFSAVRAEVIDDQDDTTQPNVRFVQPLTEVDIVLVAGIAGDVCLAHTMGDTYEMFADKSIIHNFVLLTDAIPAIDDKRCNQFIDVFVKRGMKLSTTTSFMV